MAFTKVESGGLVSNIELPGDYIVIPSGTTAERPGSANAGMLRYNTSLGLAEYYDGNGWKSIDSPPSIQNASPSSVLTGNANITINGSFFTSGSTVKFIGANGTEYNSPSVTFNSTTQLVAQTPSTPLSVDNEPYSIKVTNPSGLSATLTDAIDAGATPTWSTSAGTLRTIFDEGETSYSNIATLSASDADNQDITYTENAGVLSAAGLSLNSSTGVISGNPSNVTNSVTKTFTVTASDGVNSTNRTFNIIINQNLATSWYKNENISTANTYSWNDSISGKHFAWTPNNGSTSDLSYNATDANFNNLKSFQKSSNSYGCLTAGGTNGDFYTYNNSFSCLVVYQKTGNNGTTLGDAMINNIINGTGDGSWSLDIGGDHTWGGGYPEYFGDVDYGQTVPKKGIFLARINGTSGASLLDYPANGGSWSVIDTASGNHPTNLSFNRISLFNFTHATHTGHSWIGRIAEVIWFKDTWLTDTQRDYWTSYLREKFNF